MKLFIYLLGCCCYFTYLPAHAAKLAIIIDDFGYRVSNEEKILDLSPAVSVAVLPNAPYGQKMARAAHYSGHDILIHLPMQPFSKQPLEKDTIMTSDTEADIQRIIADAVVKVPYAKGVNNHMGSAMTSDMNGMLSVMRTLAQYQFFYIDSKTTAKSQAVKAAREVGVPVLSRNIFLDDDQKESAVRGQFYKAIKFARKYGVAIAIGHPHPNTVLVLEQELANLPPDIELVSISSLFQTSKPVIQPLDERLLQQCDKPEETTVQPVLIPQLMLFNGGRFVFPLRE